MPDESGAGEKVIYFMFGALVGAVTALLLAPRSGEETRRLIAGKARESTEYLTSRGKEVVEKASGYIERGKEAIQQQKDQLSAALEAGKQAYKEEKAKT